MFISLFVFIIISVIIFYFIIGKYYITEQYELKDITTDKTTHIRGNYIDIYYNNEKIRISKELDNAWYLYNFGTEKKIKLQYNKPFVIEKKKYIIVKNEKSGGLLTFVPIAIVIVTVFSLFLQSYIIMGNHMSNNEELISQIGEKESTTDADKTPTEIENSYSVKDDNIEDEKLLNVDNENNKAIDWNSYQNKEDMRRSLKNNSSEMGISVSKYQGTIDWQKVKDDEIDFAIIQVGSRGNETGNIKLDPYFDQNMNGAIANNIKIGVCIYSQAITYDEVDEEIELIINSVKNYTIDYPIGFSLARSEPFRTFELSDEEYINIIKYYCSRIEQEGYTPMIMGNRDWFQKFPKETFYEYLKLVYSPDIAPNDIDNCIIWQFEHEAEEAVDGLGKGIKVSMNLSAYTH